jgi:predicted dehydrogenase
MESNALVHINFDLAARSPRINFEIIGTEGTLIWDRMNSKIDYFTSTNKEWRTETYSSDDTLAMYPNQARYFVDCIKSGNKPSTDIEDAIKTQKVIDASFKSSIAGKIIYF